MTTEKHTEHKNIWSALTAAQARFTTAAKTAVNPHFRSKYADLAGVVAAVQPALSENGLCFYHQAIVGDGPPVMRTTLMHGVSETSIQCDIPLLLQKQDMQGYKSATTYAKRIGLESVTGIAPEDDDGNGATRKDKPPVNAISPEQVKALVDIAAVAGYSGEQVAARYGVKAISELSSEQFEYAETKLQERIAKKQAKPSEKEEG